MLKLKLWQIENIVLMKVLEQDIDIRGKGLLYDNNVMRIHSTDAPDLQVNDIYVRGVEDSVDDLVVVYESYSVQGAGEYIAKVKEVVHEYNMQQQGKWDNDDDVKVYIAE